MKKHLFIAFSSICFFCLFLLPPLVAKAKNPLSFSSWGYLLQNVTEDKVANSPFELVVIEPQLESDGFRLFDKQSVNKMRLIPHSKTKRIVLAYISIGEAESYRPYWQKEWDTNPPAWLGEENPDWEGNYKVRFWKRQWQQIILKQLDSILASGFDGIYLDIVDAWEYWSDIDTYKKKMEVQQATDPIDDEVKAAGLMLDWLHIIASHTRKTSPASQEDFLVFPQNGERLLNFLNQNDKNRFWNLVNGIGVESVFFYGEKADNNDLNMDKERLTILRGFTIREKPVLSVEYITEPHLIREYYKLADRFSFQPYTSIRELDRFMPQLERNAP